MRFLPGCPDASYLSRRRRPCRCLRSRPRPAVRFRSAQDSSALINEALDKPVEVELKTTLPNALNEIKNRTGVPIELAPGVLERLPWGDQTTLNLTIKNQTLRQAIAAIARTLGLVHVLTPEAVELRPMPALQRLGRRATVEELKVLDLLASNPLSLDKQQQTPPDDRAAPRGGRRPAARARRQVRGRVPPGQHGEGHAAGLRPAQRDARRRAGRDRQGDAAGVGPVGAERADQAQGGLGPRPAREADHAQLRRRRRRAGLVRPRRLQRRRPDDRARRPAEGPAAGAARSGSSSSTSRSGRCSRRSPGSRA